MRAIRTILTALVALGFLATPSLAQSYPSKPIHIIVPFAAGRHHRILARGTRPAHDGIVRPAGGGRDKVGGAGHVGTDSVAKSPPDGYTLMVGPDASFVFNPHLYSKLPYDPVNDFIPVSGLGISPQGLVINPSVAGELACRADRSRQTETGRAQLRHFGIGTSGHLNIVCSNRKPARSSRRSITRARRRHHRLARRPHQMMIVAVGLLRQNVDAGKLRPAGGRQQGAAAAVSRYARDRRDAAGLRSRLLVRPSSRRRAPRRRSSTSSARKRRRFSAIRRSATSSWRRR